MRRIILATLAMLLAQGCSTCEPMAEDYDRSCQLDDDCQVVFLHRDCECSDTTAINKSEVRQFRGDNNVARSIEWCPKGEAVCDSARLEAYCDAGLCQTREK